MRLARPLVDLVEEVEEDVVVEAAGDLLDVDANHGGSGVLIGTVSGREIEFLREGRRGRW